MCYGPIVAPRWAHISRPLPEKKKNSPREQKNVLLLLFYFPKMLLPGYHAFLQKLQKKNYKKLPKQNTHL